MIASSNSICIDPRDWIFYAISRCNGILAIVCSWKNYIDWFLCWMQVTIEKKKKKERRENVYTNINREKCIAPPFIIGWLPHIYNKVNASNLEWRLLRFVFPSAQNTRYSTLDVIILCTVRYTRVQPTFPIIFLYTLRMKYFYVSCIKPRCDSMSNK